jgi:outer membrane protein insertion porin family
MRRLVRVVLWCVLCAWPAAARADVADYLGKTVRSIRFTIEDRDTADPAITQLVSIGVGRPLVMADVRQSVTHLFSLGRFEDVRVDATLDGGQVSLRFLLAPIRSVTRIRFAGGIRAAGVDEGALRRAILDRYGSSPPASRAADMIRLLEDALRERGYLHPSIELKSEPLPASDSTALVFTVDARARTRIGSVEVAGTPNVPQRELVSRLGLVTGAPYQREVLSQRIAGYVEERRRRGYYEARVVPTVHLADEDRVANIAVTVTPGPHVRVVFAGDALPSDQRAELVPVEREGSVDEDLLEDSSNRIEEFLRAQGYRQASAPHARQEQGDELLITFTVTKGPLYRVASVEISENAAVPRADFEAALRLREGQPFSDARLDADVVSIEEIYRRRGFAAAKADPGVDPQASRATAAEVPVVVRIVVREGVRTVVDAVTFDGNASVAEGTLRAAVGLQAGGPYIPALVAVDRDAILLAYQNLGYQTATVEAQPQFTPDATHVTVRFAIREGPRIFVDHILIVGNARTKSETIERELQLKPGDPFSLSAINESQRRLSALGLFRRSRISELRHGDETTRDLLVTVEEAPPTTIGYGGGVEGKLRAVGTTDQFELAPRAFFEVGRRNLFGKNRSVSLFTSLSLPKRFIAGSADTAPGLNSLTEYRLIGTFREPRLLNTPVDGFANVTLEQQRRSSFDFRRSIASLDAGRKITPTIAVTGSYQIQRTEVFVFNVNPEDVLAIDRLFPQFRLSSFSAAVIRDTRDDPVDPSHGGYASVNGQLAGEAIGSEVGFLKSFFTAQLFRTLPHSNRIVLAGSARLGMATGFTAGVQLPASERFFAGGDTTVRGFALDRLGVRHVPSQPSDTVDEEGVPIGGNGLVIFNAELRAPVSGGLAVVGFLDTGNVFARTTDLDLAELRSALGGGVRYKSPFGPVRFDLGFKVNRQPGEGLTAWFVSFGQAF